MNADSVETETGDENKAQTQRSLLTAYRLKRGALLYWAVLFTMSAAIMHSVAVLNQLPPSALLAVLLIGFTIVQAVVAIAVVAVPARRFLFVAGIVEAVGLLIWLVAHIFGLPDGFAVWRLETLGVPDLYIPFVEGISAVFFLCLSGRTWNAASRAWRLSFTWLPRLLLLGLLIWGVLKSVAIVVVFLVPGVFSNLQYFFLPIVGLLAVFMILRLVIRPLRMKTPRAWRTTSIVLPALLVLGFLTWGGSVSAIDTAWLSTSTPVSVLAGQTATLMYCKSSVNGSPLAMDISEPSAQAPRPAPMVFYIHGGETLVGSRILQDGTSDGMYFDQLRTDLLNRDFIVGSIDYSLVGFDVGQYLNQSSSVQAVVDMWGPADLSDFSGSPWWVSLLKGNGTKAQFLASSPVSHVAHSDPPFLIMHGADDWFIAPHHSQDLAKLLRAAGVPVTLVMIQHDGHGLDMPTAGQVEQPSPSTLIQMIADFFSRTLSA